MSKLIKSENLHIDTVFALKYKGLTSYRQSLVKKERKHFDELIHNAETHWFNPEMIWKKWIKARIKLTVLLPNWKETNSQTLAENKDVFNKKYLNTKSSERSSIEEKYLADLNDDED